MGRINIGQKFLTSSMSPTFKIGETLVTFSCSGKILSLNQLRKIRNDG